MAKQLNIMEIYDDLQRIYTNWVSRVQERSVCQIEEPQPPDLLSPQKTCKEADKSTIGEAAVHKEKVADKRCNSEESEQRDSKWRRDWMRFARAVI